MFELAVQLIEIAIFVPLILFGLSRVGAYALQKAEGEEDAYFILMFGMMAAAGVLARTINLPDIVGAFLAGVAVNAAVHDKPAKEKLEFFGKAFFIPIFFVVTGFLIDPIAFAKAYTTISPFWQRSSSRSSPASGWPLNWLVAPSSTRQPRV